MSTLGKYHIKEKLLKALSLTGVTMSAVALLGTSSAGAMSFNQHPMHRHVLRPMRIEERVNVNNNTNINIHNTVNQNARSGDVMLSRFNKGGEAFSGNATNIAVNTFNVNVNNNTSVR